MHMQLRQVCSTLLLWGRLTGGSQTVCCAQRLHIYLFIDVFLSRGGCGGAAFITKFLFQSHQRNLLWKFAFLVLCLSPAVKTNTLLNLPLNTSTSVFHSFPSRIVKSQCHLWHHKGVRIQSLMNSGLLRSAKQPLLCILWKANLLNLLSRAPALSHLTAFISFAEVCSRRFVTNIGRETQFAPNQLYLCGDRKQNTINKKSSDIKTQPEFDLNRGLSQDVIG